MVLGFWDWGLRRLAFSGVVVLDYCLLGTVTVGLYETFCTTNIHTHTHIRYKQLDDDDYDDGQPNGGNSKGGDKWIGLGKKFFLGGCLYGM